MSSTVTKEPGSPGRAEANIPRNNPVPDPGSRRTAGRPGGWLWRLLRSPQVYRWVSSWGWNRPAETLMFTSTAQAAALSPALATTHPPITGWLQGQDGITHQPITASPQGMYQAGLITVPGVLIAGDVGLGKSTLMKVNAARGIACGDLWAVFDRKRQRDHESSGDAGEYWRLAQAVGGQVLTFSRDRTVGTRINILDPAIRTAGHDDTGVGQDELLLMVATAALGVPLTAEQRYVLAAAHRAALDTARQDGRVAVLGDVIEALYRPSADAVPGPRDPVGTPHLTAIGLVDQTVMAQWGLSLALALERLVTGDLSGLLDGETSGPNGAPVNLDAPLLVMDTSALPADSTALGLVMAVMSTYLMGRWMTMPGYKNLVVEEGYSADKLQLVPAMFRTLAKRSRGVGASVWSVFHHVSDVDDASPLVSLMRETELAFLFRQSKADDAARLVDLLNLPPSCQEILLTLPRGQYLLVRGKRIPPTTVTQFRTSLEVWITDTDSAMRGTP